MDAQSPATRAVQKKADAFSQDQTSNTTRSPHSDGTLEVPARRQQNRICSANQIPSGRAGLGGEARTVLSDFQRNDGQAEFRIPDPSWQKALALGPDYRHQAHPNNGSLRIIGTVDSVREGREDEVLPIPVDLDDAVLLDLLLEQRRREWIGQPLLNDSFQRTGTVGWIESLVGQLRPSLSGHSKCQSSFRELSLEALQLDIDDLGQLFHPQWMEDDRLVDSVEEFGQERRSQDFLDLPSHSCFVAGLGKLGDDVATQV